MRSYTLAISIRLISIRVMGIWKQGCLAKSPVSSTGWEVGRSRRCFSVRPGMVGFMASFAVRTLRFCAGRRPDPFCFLPLWRALQYARTKNVIPLQNSGWSLSGPSVGQKG